MTERLTYELKINAFTPATIPLGRLSEYMADLAGVLGEPNSVHFGGLSEGSTVLKAVIEKEAITRVSARLQSVHAEAAVPDLAKAYKSLDNRLYDDNAEGTLTAFLDDAPGAVIIRFPGRDRTKPLDYGLIKERGSIEGMPVSITGRDATKHMQLSDGREHLTGISMSEDLAIRVMDAGCVYRKVIRLHGTGRWLRDEDGAWKLDAFKADDFEVLDNSSLRDTIQRLRAVQGTEWRETDDPLKVLQEIRGDSDEDRVH